MRALCQNFRDALANSATRKFHFPEFAKLFFSCAPVVRTLGMPQLIRPLANSTFSESQNYRLFLGCPLSELQNCRSFQFLSLWGVLGSALWSLLGGPGLSWFSMDPSGRSLVAGSLAPFGSVTGDLLVGSSWLGPWGHLVGPSAGVPLGVPGREGRSPGGGWSGPLWAWLGPWGHLVGPSAGDGRGGRWACLAAGRGRPGKGVGRSPVGPWVGRGAPLHCA